MKTNTKIIAASLSMVSSMSAVAGMGGVNVQSNLGEPFSGSITVTGHEAQALIKNGSVNVSGGNIHGTVIPKSNGDAVVHLRSSSAVQDPILNFTVQAGNQTRQYTAMVNPANYNRSAQTNRMVAAADPEIMQPVSDDTPVEPVAHHGKARHTTKRQRHAASPSPRMVQQQTTSPRYHRVRRGETLPAIAARVRPHNMSVMETMIALVYANPRAFRNGNPYAMYRNVTLYIPSASQWRFYAHTTSYGSNNRSLNEAHRAKTQQNAAAQDMAENTAANNTTAPKSQAQTEPANKPATQQQPATESAVPEKASPADNKVADNAQAAASETTAQSQNAKTVASEPQQAAPTASAPDAAASQAAASAPQPEPKERPTPPPAEESQPEEEGTDWTTIGLGAGAGVLVLGGAAYLLSRRRKSGSEEETEDDDAEDLQDDVRFDASSADTFWETDSNTQTTSKATSEGESDFFDLPAEETVQAAPTNDSFDLDDFEPNVSSEAERKSEELEDWNWSGDDAVIDATGADTAEEWQLGGDEAETAIEDATSSAASEDDDWLKDTASLLDNLDAPNTAPQTAAPADTAADDWLNDDIFSVEPSTPSTNEAPTASAETSSIEIASDDWLKEDFSAQAPAKDAPAKPVEDTFDIGSATAETPAADTIPNFDDFADLSPATNTSASDNALDFSLNDDAFAVHDQPQAADSTLSSDAQFNLDTPAETHDATQETSFSDFNLDFDAPAATETNTVSTAPEIGETDSNLDTPADTHEAASKTSFDDFNLDFDAPAVPETEAAPAVPEIAEPAFDLNTPGISVSEPSLDIPAISTDNSINFDTDFAAPETPAAEPEKAATFDDADALSFDMPTEETTAAQEEKPAIHDVAFDADALAFTTTNDNTFSLNEPVVETVSQPETSSDIENWDMPAAEETPAPAAPTEETAQSNDAGFVSEAVGLTEPQEAKLELAKMYLEIDDAVTARETLRELIAESHGDIQLKAQKLLDEVGG